MTSLPSLSIGMSASEQVIEQIETLRSQLLANNPGMPMMLRTIHTALKKDPEIVTLLSDEQIGIIVNGLMKQTQTAIVSASVKAPAKKALKALTVDDL